jgi:hypothetical protein
MINMAGNYIKSVIVAGFMVAAGFRGYYSINEPTYTRTVVSVAFGGLLGLMTCAFLPKEDKRTLSQRLWIDE